jgi:AraC-like DNA-binding protein
LDALVEILNSIHFHGSLWCRTEARAPWGMSIPQTDSAQFHFLLRGSAYVKSDKTADYLPIESGDLIILTQGDAHILVDRPGSTPIALQTLIEQKADDSLPGLHIGGDGAASTIICGYFHLERSAFHPLFTALPDILYLRGEENRSLPWLETTLSFLSAESIKDKPAAQALINRLTEILFILVLRAHLQRNDDQQQNWLNGLNDPLIGEALHLIHSRPHNPWTIESLAKAAGMSRANFSLRFKDLVGASPFQYLTQWRLFRASSLLLAKSLSISEIAEQVGYSSEASFSKAFSKHIGNSPGRFRRETLQRDTVSAG